MPIRAQAAKVPLNLDVAADAQPLASEPVDSFEAQDEPLDAFRAQIEPSDSAFTTPPAEAPSP